MWYGIPFPSRYSGDCSKTTRTTIWFRIWKRKMQCEKLELKKKTNGMTGDSWQAPVVAMSGACPVDTGFVSMSHFSSHPCNLQVCFLVTFDTEFCTNKPVIPIPMKAYSAVPLSRMRLMQTLRSPCCLWCKYCNADCQRRNVWMIKKSIRSLSIIQYYIERF